MSCGHDNFDSSDNCVCSTLLAVAEAQDRVEDDCISGCRQAIDELNGRTKIKGFDTIPVLLTIKGRPFFAVGAVRNRNYPSDRLFDVEKSFLFRVSEVDGDTCCATLELLETRGSRGHKNHSDDSDDSSSSSSSSSSRKSAFNSQVNRSKTDDFEAFLDDLEDAKKIIRTGVCVTVDLKQFSSVSCLPPVNTN